MSSINEFDHLRVSLKEIEQATAHFSDENLIGRGRHAMVYKGQLLWSGKQINVAVKRLDSSFIDGDMELYTEISILSYIEHENVNSIIGFSDENNEKIIIKKYEAKESLDKYLSSPSLTWMQRLHICAGAACALSYIHCKEGRNYGIMHRNIKSSKILLDDTWNAKVSGFELSMVNPAGREHRLLLSPTLGTLEYVDPVSIRTGSVTYKSDSYSFGMVLFEVLCGRLCTIKSDDNDEQQLLAPSVKLKYGKGTLDEMIPPYLRKQMNEKSFKVFSETAYYCLKEQRTQRPAMDQIYRNLIKALKLQRIHETPKVGRPSVAVRTSSDYLKEKFGHLMIPFEKIRSATCNFDKSKCIGVGGYGKVYEAELEYHDNKRQRVDEDVVPMTKNIVAIKRISSRQDTQGEQGFITEIEMLTSCNHPNVVSLLGFCDEGQEMILVYEHASKGSLHDHLRSIDKLTNHTWMERLQMCLDIAHGLNHLHTNDTQRIIHRDIKSANILLDDNWKAKIADFGLSKFAPLEESFLKTQVFGTSVYIDPEYAKTHKLKNESDIYSFGVVLFEILCGRLAHDKMYYLNNEQGLPSIARRRFNEKTIKEIIDPKVMEETDENVFTLNKGPNEESLNTFLKIAYKCLAETQAKRPTMKVVIAELQKALDFQVKRVDILKVSQEQILLATENFNEKNFIAGGGFGNVYRGEVVHGHQPLIVAIKRHVPTRGQGEQEFLTELEVLFEYKHENLISLVGYNNEMDEKIIVYEHESLGSVDKYLNNANLTWAKRIKICIDVANGLNFLHGGVRSEEMVVHRDIKSNNILLDGNWKAKISDFGLSIIMPINPDRNHVICNPVGTLGYVDPHYFDTGFLTKECDIFSLGVVLVEMMCGPLALFVKNGQYRTLENLFRCSFEQGKVDDIVFDGIKANIVPKSLRIFSEIAYQCLHVERKERPTADQVIVRLKEALGIQEDYDIWQPQLPRDYVELMQMSSDPNIYATENKKDLYGMFRRGILLQNGKVWFSLSANGMRNEMISATMFSYKNQNLCKWNSTQNSRFPAVAEMLDISDLKIEVKITPQYLSPDHIYAVYVVFKFCDPRKFSAKPVYVNLKYNIGSETLYSHFATWRDSEWMMIELGTFLNRKETTDFEVILESFSHNCCGSCAIFVQGIEFQAIDNVKDGDVEKSKKEQKVLKSNSSMDNVQPLAYDIDEVINTSNDYDEGEKMFLPRKVNGKKFHMLPAKMILYDSSNVKCFNWIPLAKSRFVEVAELLAHQAVLRIKCKIETQRLSSDTDYACYLVFKLSQECHGLECPVKVRNVLLKGSKEKTNILYFRSPSSLNVDGIRKVPEQRQDGLMEVIVSEFNSSCELNNDHHLPMNLKLKCYEGTMSGLIVYGMEFRAI